MFGVAGQDPDGPPLGQQGHHHRPAHETGAAGDQGFGLVSLGSFRFSEINSAIFVFSEDQNDHPNAEISPNHIPKKGILPKNARQQAVASGRVSG